MLLLVTAATRDEAENLGEALVEKGLASRGSVIPGIHSFWQEGERLERSHEAMLMITTTAAKRDAAAAYLRENHSFEAPQIISLAVADQSD